VRAGGERPYAITDRIIVIGDVHGCAKALAIVLEDILLDTHATPCKPFKKRRSMQIRVGMRLT
jgi:hypothetical protein